MSDKQIDMFSSNDGQAEVAVHFTEDAAWLSQGQMVELFGKAKKTCIRIARCKIFFPKFVNQKDDAHLDHAWPYFSHMVSGFRAAKGWSRDIPDGIVSAPADGQTTATFVDSAVTEAF